MTAVTMETLFTSILNMSFTAGTVILAVLVLRLFLKKAPKIFSYCLWAAVLIRLLCPVSFPAPFAPLGLIKAPSASAQTPAYLPESLILQQAAAPASEAGMEPAAASAQPKTGGSKSPALFSAEGLMHKGAVLWLVGMSMLALSCLFRLVRLRRILKTASWDKENIYLADGIGTPFVIGIFRTKIYLPFGLNKEEKEYVLLHEQVHIKRKDYLIKLISFLALCLHWFNPLVWAAFLLSSRDMEMSCDEAVIRKIGNNRKKDYSCSLLSMAAGKTIAGGMTAAFGEGDVRGRIQNILHYKKPASAAVKCAALFCAAAVIVLLANPASAKEAAPASAQKESRTHRQNLINRQNSARNNAGSQADDRLQDNAGGQEDSSATDPAVVQNRLDYQNPDSMDALTASAQIRLPADAAKTGRTFYEIDIHAIDQDKQTVRDYTPPSAFPTGFPFPDGEPLSFAKDCQFMVNYSLNSGDYQNVTFGEFASFIEKGGTDSYKPCLLGFENGQITYAALESAWYHFGIFPVSAVTCNFLYDSLIQSEGRDAFSKKYTLISTRQADIADCEGTETIEVYADSSTPEKAEIGIVLFKDAQGQLLCTQDAASSRAGWNNIYLCQAEGTSFILKLNMDDRYNDGEFRYQLYRLDDQGRYLLASSSQFSFQLSQGSRLIYDDALFREWIRPLEYYLENSRLIISSQNGTIRTDNISEADTYNYDTLNLKERAAAIAAEFQGGGLLPFQNSWYGTAGLSEETIQWLTWYSGLSETQQQTVSYVPQQLYDDPLAALKEAGTAPKTSDAQRP